MCEARFVKIMFDGQEYWLLWEWNKHLSPTQLRDSYTYASGPFHSAVEAETAITSDWTPIRYLSA